mmetsp:Transcript_47078/g.131291  ORF Transcript_47078/g.131291 Transcript_47078/m.131291 type:complete len:361 (-) Transcript_47078:593-1675(-)
MSSPRPALTSRTVSSNVGTSTFSPCDPLKRKTRLDPSASPQLATSRPPLPSRQILKKSPRSFIPLTAAPRPATALPATAGGPASCNGHETTRPVHLSAMSRACPPGSGPLLSTSANEKGPQICWCSSPSPPPATTTPPEMEQPKSAQWCLKHRRICKSPAKAPAPMALGSGGKDPGMPPAGPITVAVPPLLRLRRRWTIRRRLCNSTPKGPRLCARTPNAASVGAANNWKRTPLRSNAVSLPLSGPARCQSHTARSTSSSLLITKSSLCTRPRRSGALQRQNAAETTHSSKCCSAYCWQATSKDSRPSNLLSGSSSAHAAACMRSVTASSVLARRPSRAYICAKRNSSQTFATGTRMAPT